MIFCDEFVICILSDLPSHLIFESVVSWAGVCTFVCQLQEVICAKVSVQFSHLLNVDLGCRFQTCGLKQNWLTIIFTNS